MNQRPRTDLAQRIHNLTKRPPVTGVAQPTFTATVLGIGPLRIQAEAEGVQLEAVALFGYTPAAGHRVLAWRAGATVYVSRIS